MNVCVEIAALPEVFAFAPEPTGGGLLEGLEELAEQNFRRLVDQQMHVLGHENVGIDAGAVALAGLFEESFRDVLCHRCGKVGRPPETAEGDEMKGLGLLEPLQTGRHEGNRTLRVSWTVYEFCGEFPLIAMMPR